MDLGAGTADDLNMEGAETYEEKGLPGFEATSESATRKPQSDGKIPKMVFFHERAPDHKQRRRWSSCTYPMDKVSIGPRLQDQRQEKRRSSLTIPQIPIRQSSEKSV